MKTQDHTGGYRMAKLRGNRAVSYSRVSSNKEEQKTSIESQKLYYLNKFNSGGLKPAPVGVICNSRGDVTITNNGIYADEGISGTSLKHRKAFNTMIEDAHKGKFDVIYVKSVSRFARSSVDGKLVVEELRDLGVAVVFEDIGLNTVTSPNDFTMSVLMEVAEEESRSKSESVKWGIHQQIRQGTYMNSIPLGYSRVEKEVTINAEEAKIVKFIFDQYTEYGISLLQIANMCMERGYKTSTGNERWRTTGVLRILQNELYKGVVRQHKTVSTTFKDGGKRKKVDPEDTIVNYRQELAIIEADQWDRAHDLIDQRGHKRENQGNRYSSTHTFSSLVYCDCCKSAYTRRLNNRGQVKSGKAKNALYQWCCCERDLHGKRVCNKEVRNSISEMILEKAVKKEIRKLQNSTEELKKIFYIYELVLHGFPADEAEIEELGKREAELSTQIKKVMLRASLDDISGGIYDDLLDELEEELRGIKQRLAQITYREEAIQGDNIAFNKYLEELKGFNLEELSNTSLKRIFNKIWVVDTLDYLPQSVVGSQRRGLVFDYKFMKISYFELIDKALELKYPEALDLEIVRV